MIVKRRGATVDAEPDLMGGEDWFCPSCSDGLSNSEVRLQVCSTCGTDLDPDLWDIDEDEDPGDNDDM